MHGARELISPVLNYFTPSPGDHLYRMDYRHFVSHHKRSGAAITIAALPCDEKAATGFGLMEIDQEVGLDGLMSRVGKRV